MARTDHGILRIEFETWRSFADYVLETFRDEPGVIWRGQRNPRWRLEPSIDRALRSLGFDPSTTAWEEALFRHLERFKLASRSRGRIDPRDLVASDASRPDRTRTTTSRLSDSAREENNWWSIGQHYGLRTPLLDWTVSPFVASFFAYEHEQPHHHVGTPRIVFGLNRRSIDRHADALHQEPIDHQRMPLLEFIEPHYKDNPRLVSQGGLLTRSQDGIPMRQWVRASFDGPADDVWLLELVLPDSERVAALRTLNRMNINHQSLFPDLYGATAFVNAYLQVPFY